MPWPPQPRSEFGRYRTSKENIDEVVLLKKKFYSERAHDLLLVRDDATFAADYATMQATLRVEPHAVRGAVGRCDRAVIEAWMNARFAEYAGESWATFRARVQGALPALIEKTIEPVAEQTVAVFTSATPIALTVSSVLNLTNDKTLGLMAMLQNSSVTTLRIREGEVWLFGFNTTPHLPDATMRTFR